MKGKRNKFKVIIGLMCFVICVGFLSSCGKEKQSETQHESSETTPEETTETDVTENESPAEEITESTQEIMEQEEILLPGVFPMEFTFSSGAGAWATSMILNADGSFEGIYHDSEMGDSGEDYPNGSVYICAFSGKFDDIKKVNDDTYSMILSGITTQDTEGEEWIEDKIRYVASIPYGLEEGKEFFLYTPETPVEELSEEFLSWWPNNYLSGEERPETLSCYGLYNKEMEYGFFTYE